jgi:pre-mRNA-splicing factor SYF1
VEWARQQLDQLPRVPSLAFSHIPLPHHRAAWDSGSLVSGTKGEAVGCPGVDSGFFELAR